MTVPAQRVLCVLCKGTGRYHPGVCRRCRGAGWDPELTAPDAPPAPAARRVPVLAGLALAVFLAMWAVEFAAMRDMSGGVRVLGSLVMAVLFGWPALFALARSVGAGAFGQAMRPALTVLAPVLAMLALRALVALLPDAGWPGIVAGIWLFAMLAAVPFAWVMARGEFARRRSVPGQAGGGEA